MKLTSFLLDASRGQPAAPQHPAHYYYKTMIACADADSVRETLIAAAAADFDSSQISILVREREYWHALHERGPTVLMRPSPPGSGDESTESRNVSLLAFARIAGVAFHGGVGLMAHGPLAPALAHLGLEALAGSPLDPPADGHSGDAVAGMGDEATQALDSGRWLVIVHTHDEAGAARIRRLRSGALSFHEVPLNEHL